MSVVHRREIVIQQELDDIFVIKEGVGVGDRIVLEGIRQVRDGEKVEYEYRYTVFNRALEIRRPEEVMGRQENQAPAPRAVNTISPRTQAILATLEQTIPISFADAQLDDVLRYIKHATFKEKKPTDPGLLQIYVDPRVERALTSKVRMDASDAPLRLTLSMLLDQVGLAYLVKDDVLIISSPQGIEVERNETPSSAADETPGTKRVLAKLEEPIPMTFANPIPLDDMLNYIRQATVTRGGDDGIPIVSDPRPQGSRLLVDLDREHRPGWRAAQDDPEADAQATWPGLSRQGWRRDHQLSRGHRAMEASAWRRATAQGRAR